MFKFTTTTIINSNLDTSGKPLFEKIQKGHFTVGKAEGDETKSNDRTLVRRVNTFDTCNIKAAYKREFRAEQVPVITVDVADLVTAASTKDVIGRVSLYVRLVGAQPSDYANATSIAGKPIHIEFPVKAGSTAGQVVDKIVKITNKYINFVYENKLISVSKGGGDKLQIKGVTGEQKFDSVKLEVWGEGETFKTLSELVAGVDESGKIEVTTPGEVGFGTYRHIIKDLRGVSQGFFAPAQDEVPVVGGQYDQYTIHYETYRGVLGTDAVGDQVTSITEHVFYVNKAVNVEWEAAWAGVAEFITVAPNATKVKDHPEPEQVNANFKKKVKE